MQPVRDSLPWYARVIYVVMKRIYRDRLGRLDAGCRAGIRHDLREGFKSTPGTFCWTRSIEIHHAARALFGGFEKKPKELSWATAADVLEEFAETHHD